MKNHAVRLALGLGLTLATAGLASAQQAAESEADYPIQFDQSSIVGGTRGFIYTGDIPAAAGQPSSNIIYLNFCQDEVTSTGAPGCRVNGGQTNDSRLNRSNIAQGNLAAYTGSTSTKNAIVQCVRDTYAPFGVQIVTTDPGNVPHFEAMAAGLPTQIGFPNGVAGVAPFTCGVINNAITFSFLNLFPSNVNEACWTISQEVAHAFGLSHEMLASDPMTYIQNPPLKRFQDQTACVGTQGCCQPQGECRCQTQQNSYQELLAIFGTSTPTPPVIMIETPSDNAQVTPGFVVRAAVTDDQGVALVELMVDSNVTASLVSPPYAFNAPLDLGQGTHSVTIRATDTIGSVGTASINVIVGDPCNDNDDCEAQGSGLVCFEGACIPGPGTPGGIGSDCSVEPCISGVCATKDGENRCTEECDPNANTCPGGFACLNNGAGGGLCWPDAGGCLGCSTGGTGGTDPMLPIGAGLLLAALMVRRRRSR